MIRKLFKIKNPYCLRYSLLKKGGADSKLELIFKKLIIFRSILISRPKNDADKFYLL